MPMPRFVAEINKHTLNKRALKKGSYPVITHVGRTSGKIYHTPLDAEPIDNGFIFVLVYGSQSDWVQNVLAAGTAQLAIGERNYDLNNPRLIDKATAEKLLPPATKSPPGILNISEYLQMDIKSQT